MSNEGQEASTSSGFEFEISLTVLNHLGRQLYRNFITILGEAISNSWDADAANVYVTLDHETQSMLIVDDGVGMTPSQLQDRFLKVGYSKRKSLGTATSQAGRPYIGAKGIGKLALLSCANKVSVATKVASHEVCGCLIDNRELDRAIQDDITPDQLTLPVPNDRAVQALEGSQHGTALYFEGVRAGNNTDEFLTKALALYFRFSLVDPTFAIHYNGSEITSANLAPLAKSTQYVWATPQFDDPFLRLTNARRDMVQPLPQGATGFIASVEKPRQLEIYGSGSRIGVDLFVNGRLRERDLLQRLPTARVPAQYLYGQLHLNQLDSGNDDPFTSSREGVIEGNQLYDNFIGEMRPLLNKILDDWDEYRIDDKQPGDQDNKRLRPVERAARSLSQETIKEVLPKGATPAQAKLFTQLDENAQAAAQDYMAIYVVENALRSALSDASAVLPSPAKSEAGKRRQQNAKLLHKAGLSIPIRTTRDDLSYLGLTHLMDVADEVMKTDLFASSADAPGIHVLRNSVMHTAELTQEGKRRLASIRDNMTAKTREMIRLLQKKQTKDSK